MAVMEGSLSKWTNVMKGWQYRWFVLDDNSGLLSYYTSKEKMMRGVRRGCVRLKGAVIGIDDEDDSTFTITVDHKTFHFQARDAEEREKWVRALEETIFRHGNASRWDNTRPPPTIKDFDNKVSEADAYLQLMIDQTKALEDRIETITDNDEKLKCQVILNHSNAMLDNIKHSIVLLQIAKNTAHPINGIYQKPSPVNNMEPLEIGPSLMGQTVPQSGVELGSECLEARRHSTRSMVGGPTALVVPEMSYSSSEGEDDFYDANDLPFSPSSTAQTPMGLRNFASGPEDDEKTTTDPAPNTSRQVLQSSSTHSAINQNKKTRKSPSVDKRSSNIQHNATTSGLDYDALYEEEEETGMDLESQGSVIKHLLTQVKIGMDLTKVVLPTFILERRSLLEMYADYFAHPDLFIEIADFKTPKERMVQVVRWYMSSYHAGRKATVAKKPYNPILGEVFKCYWDIPNFETDSALVEDGPVPWCHRNNLSFVAEQVSHHPPISAFYAEHYNKRISFNAHVYTKSKFLGLSICVYNIGCGIVKVSEYDEEYIVTFPNGYGRSILTVPWIELGGTVTITCPQTKYNCNIEFLTKPFYGNKKHRINAEVFSPDDKKPFLTITGEWNGIMEAKWADREQPEEFIDVHKLSIVKKRVRPIKQQLPNESRNLWKEVTAGLKYNNIDMATNAKQALEQKQRDEAKDRKELNTEWDTVVFAKGPEDSWIYRHPLQTRLQESSAT